VPGSSGNRFELQPTTGEDGGGEIEAAMDMPLPLDLPPAPASLAPADFAFFFDFDGTLAGIVDDPAAARIDPPVRDALRLLLEVSGGAVALVSGRSIGQLDKMMDPLRLPAAGVHGLERRGAEGRLMRAEIDEAALSRLHADVAAFAGRHQGLLAEFKPGSAALHYRKRPELQAQSEAFATEMAAADPAIRVVTGKMVVELKMGARTKADAIAEFMDEPPFRGRRPLFAGDDVTDEDGFAAVGARDGIAIKIGMSPTRATHRFGDMSAFHDWLLRMADAASARDASR